MSENVSPAEPAKSWGGSRRGSGRKKTGRSKVQVSAALSPSVAEYLADQPSQSRAIEDAITNQPTYRQWVVLARIRRMREKLDGTA